MLKRLKSENCLLYGVVECSVFRVRENLAYIFGFSDHYLFHYSQDFATSSLRGEVDMEEEGEEARRIVEELQLYHVVDRKLWEHK